MSSRFTAAILQTDLSYVVRGIECHMVLNSTCPPRYGLKVLEPGCGSGKLGIWYALRSASVTLLDIDPEVLAYAERLWQLARGATPITQSYSSPSFQQGSIHELPFIGNTFDFVFNEGVPQHWGYNHHDWRRQHSINEMARVTKPGGYVCVIANNADSPDIMEMAEGVAHDYRGMPARELPFTQVELAERLSKAGIEDPQTSIVRDDYRFSAPRLIAGWGTKK